MTSGTLVHTVTAYNLVDEYQLMVLMLILGSVCSLFPGMTEETVLERVDPRVSDCTVRTRTYSFTYDSSSSRD